MSSSNDHHNTPPQLTTSNYNQWAIDMTHFLNCHGLGLIITQDWVKPTIADMSKATSAERQELLAFQQAQSKAAGYLYAAVPVDQRVHIDGVNPMDAVAIWDKLKSTFVKQNSTSRFTALDTLLRVQLKEGEGLVDLAARTTRLRNEFKQLLPDGYKVDQLLDDMEVNALLNALPSDRYTTLSETLWLQSNLTRQDVHDKFIAHERKVKVDIVKTEGAMAASASSHCHSCKQLGHFAADCPHAAEIEKFISTLTTGQASTSGSRNSGKKHKKKKANQASEAKEETEAAHASVTSSIPTSDSHWNTDTGCTSHMTPHCHWFNTYKPHVVPIRLANRSVVFSAGIGSVSVQPDAKKGSSTPVELKNVLHVPSLGSNLLSVFSLTCKDGYVVYIEGNTVQFLHDKKLQFTATVNKRNIGYVNGTTLSAEDLATVAEEIAEDIIEEITVSGSVEEYANAAST